MTNERDTAGWVRRLRRHLKGRIVPNAPLGPLSSLRIGGRCEILIEPACRDDVPVARELAREARKELFVLGNLTNVLIDDAGLPGWVLRLGADLARTDWHGSCVRAEAGCALPALAREAAHRGLAGLEFAVGIPGTVGGAVAMNAGAAGTDVASVLREVHALSPEGRHVRLDRRELELGYRTSRLRRTGGWIVLDALLELAPGEQAAIERTMAGHLARRRDSQPLDLPSVGSIFKNPPDGHAARLIEAAGCKGWREGDAMVSDKHAGWIVNVGQATAEQVLTLIRRVRQAVRAQSGVELELEVVLVGPRLHALL